MRKTVIKLLIFLIPVLLYIGFCEYFLRHMPSLYRQKKEQLIENGDSIQVLVLGSSHAQDGIDPEAFTLFTHNMAFGSQSIYFDRKLVEKYLPILPNLKYVLISYEFNTLYYEHEPNRDFFYHYYYGIQYKDRNFWRESFLQFFNVYPPRQVLSQIVKSRIAPPVLLKKGYPVSRDGVVDYSEVTSDVLVGMRAKSFNRTVANTGVRDDVLSDLELLLSYLLERGITPVLITYPNYSTFRDLLDKETIAYNRKVADYLLEKYPVRHLDFFEDPDFTVTDYFNCDHLSADGAVKLSKKIDRLIR